MPWTSAQTEGEREEWRDGRRNRVGGGWVTEMFVSQTPMGMSRGQKDTSLSKVGVISHSRGISGICFGAITLQTSTIKSYVS